MPRVERLLPKNRSRSDSALALFSRAKSSVLGCCSHFMRFRVGRGCVRKFVRTAAAVRCRRVAAGAPRRGTRTRGRGQSVAMLRLTEPSKGKMRRRHSSDDDLTPAAAVVASCGRPVLGEEECFPLFKPGGCTNPRCSRKQVGWICGVWRNLRGEFECKG